MSNQRITKLQKHDQDRAWMELKYVTTKEMQIKLKKVIKKKERLDFEDRMGVQGYDTSQLQRFRDQCHHIKLRHVYYRLVARDFYTKERMLRFRMSRTDECERCAEVETYN